MPPSDFPKPASPNVVPTGDGEYERGSGSCAAAETPASVVMSTEQTTSEHLPTAVTRSPRTDEAMPPLVSATFPPEGIRLAAVERDLLNRALARAKNNKSQAARLLGLGRGQF